MFASRSHCNPTLEDNFSTTNLGIASCGIPVITCAIGGRVVSLNEETGLFVSKEYAKALFGAVEIITGNIKPFYTTQCRQTAVELYDKNLKFEEYITLYRKMSSI